MIEADIVKEDGKRRICVKGHAGFAPSGHDLVCAAVSTLLFSLSHYGRSLEKAGLLAEAPEIRLEKGFGYIALSPMGEGTEKLDGAFALTEAMLRLLAGNFPENIRISQNGG